MSCRKLPFNIRSWLQSQAPASSTGPMSFICIRVPIATTLEFMCKLMPVAMSRRIHQFVLFIELVIDMTDFRRVTVRVISNGFPRSLSSLLKIGWKA